MNSQGKRPDQTKTSEKIVFYSFIVMTVAFAVQVVLKIMSLWIV
jgi:hypothetical protein